MDRGVRAVSTRNWSTKNRSHRTCRRIRYSLTLGSIFGIEATARPGHTLAEIEAAIDEELERLRTEGPTAAEVERVRNVFETRMFSALQLVGGFGGVADLLNLYNHHTGTPDYLTQDVMRRRRVTPDSARRFAQQYLRTNARVVVHGVPGKQNLAPEPPKAGEQVGSGGTMSINADEPWRAKPPAGGPALSKVVPVPQSFQLANGLTVIALPRSAGAPVVSASLVVRSGSDANPVDKPGLASFTAALLDQGTATRNALQLADEVAQLGASLSTNSSRDAVTVTTSSLTRNFGPALTLLADVVLRPSFPAEEVERVRARRLAELVEQRSNPVQIATSVTGATLYGAHPYGFSEIGTAASNKQLTREELQGFWRQHFVPANAALIVSARSRWAKSARWQRRRWAAGLAAPRHPRNSLRQQPRRRGSWSSIARVRHRRSCVSQRSACRAAARTTFRCAS